MRGHSGFHGRGHRNFTRSGRDNLFYLYEQPICYCNGIPCTCPDTGALAETEFLTINPGWNVWDVWQVNDLPFSLMMLGVSPERQLRIWVEDAVRLGAPGALVADSIDLKGGQVEILNAKPVGLAQAQRKEQVPGPALLVNGAATLKTVRFFNRGDKATMAWPHDDSYLLDATYVQSPTNPATAGPGPTTIAGTVGQGITQPIKDLGPGTLAIAGVVGIGVLLYLNRGSIFKVRKRVRKNS